jgi:hypothetical protein
MPFIVVTLLIILGVAVVRQDLQAWRDQAWREFPNVPFRGSQNFQNDPIRGSQKSKIPFKVPKVPKCSHSRFPKVPQVPINAP